MRFLKRLIVIWLICIGIFLGIFGCFAGLGWLFADHPIILLATVTVIISAVIVVRNS